MIRKIKKKPKTSLALAAIISAVIANASGVPVPVVEAGIHLLEYAYHYIVDAKQTQPAPIVEQEK